MAYYDKIEQETLFSYDPTNKSWVIYSTYPPDIKKILERAEFIKSKNVDSDGKVIAVEGICKKNQIRLYK